MSSISYILPRVIYGIIPKFAHTFFQLPTLYFISAYMTSLKIKFSIVLHSFFLAGDEDGLVLYLFVRLTQDFGSLLWKSIL